MERFRPRRAVRARIPASTSNLGPGFDVLGMALTLHNEVELALGAAPGPLRVEISGEGADTLPRDATNLIVRTALGAAPRNIPGALRFRLLNRIPLARGLGSSAAARLGGLLAMRALFSKSALSPEGCLAEACRLEGHPDNVAAALHGGLCAVLQDPQGLRVERLAVPRGLGAVVCVPEFQLSTAKARAVLPKNIARADAVATSARVAFLIDAIRERKFRNLRFAMTDVLHQPYRRRLIPGLDRVIAAALRAGAYGAALSGAGPSIFAFVPAGPRGLAVGRAMERAWRSLRVESRALALGIDRNGASISRL